MLAIVLVSCALLAVNGFIVRHVFAEVEPALPPFFHQGKWKQAIVYLSPVLLLVVQWWAYDVLTDWLLPMRRHGKHQS